MTHCDVFSQLCWCVSRRYSLLQYRHTSNCSRSLHRPAGNMTSFDLTQRCAGTPERMQRKSHVCRGSRGWGGWGHGGNNGFVFFLRRRNINKHLAFDFSRRCHERRIIDATGRNPSGVVFIPGRVGDSLRSQKLINFVRQRA